MAQMTREFDCTLAGAPHPAADRCARAAQGERLRADAAREHPTRAPVPLLRARGDRVLRRALPRWPGLRRRALLPLQHRRRDHVRLGCERCAPRDRPHHGAAEPPRGQQLPARPRVARQLLARHDRAAPERHRGADREAHLEVREVPRAPVRARVHRSPHRGPRGSLPRVPDIERVGRARRPLQLRRVAAHVQELRPPEPAVPDARVGLGEVVDASAHRQRRARRSFWQRRPRSQATA